MFFRLCEREQEGKKTEWLFDPGGRRRQKHKNKSLNTEIKNGPTGSLQVCLTAGASGPAAGTCPAPDSKTGLDLSHLIRRGVGTDPSDLSGCKTVKMFKLC